jgi:acetoin:2,6-dichlorophenolindophenol oxidoreductase subunit beta
MKFREAVHQATLQAMDADPSVFLIGVGIIDPRAVWGTLSGALERYGPRRVVEGPLSENALMGMCVGAATQGLRPVLIHHRMDFTMLTMDQLINHAAKWRPMFGRQQHVPLVVRAVVGRGWGNGPQHTQSHHALFSHVPGLKTVVPASPSDAKGLLIAAIQDPEPVMYIEHRWMHEDEGEVSSAYEPTPIGQAAIVRHGSDATVVAVGPLVSEALKAARALADEGIHVEVIDLRTTRPIDAETVLASVARTGRLVVADADWGPCGVAGEVIALVAERALEALRSRPVRVVWPESVVPSSPKIEAQFYPGAADIQRAVLSTCARSNGRDLIASTVKQFSGPF